MKEKKMSMIISFIIVLIVIAFLVFITINGKQEISQNINMQNTEKNEGVKITVLKEGNGDVAKLGDIVAVNYTGKLSDGTIFDSNVNPQSEPFIFDLGTENIIKGWNIGVTGMKVGEKRVLEIAPELAYGASGIGGVIPPNATLIFEVELLEIKK